jgi:ubiquinone/menaquinone biosynthesis C-methylase UbiE
VLRHLDALDDEALRVFLQPGEAGVDPAVLGTAVQGEDEKLAARMWTALPAEARAAYAAARETPRSTGDVAAELVAGEHIHPRILDALGLDGRVVCDVGAGAGRFTLFAARRAARVVAVEEVPPLMRRLEAHLLEHGIDNVEVRRGSFAALPLDDNAVDIAVACSSLTSREPFGGEAALAEMERIVRPGGDIAVIWPDRPGWFRERGFVHLSAAGNDILYFADPKTAERLCREFYSEGAASWVARHRTAEVPFAVLGIRPPSDVCIRRVLARPR